MFGGDWDMKKLISCALVLSMAFSLAGCGSKGGYASTEKKVISAAEDCLGAEEANKKMKKKIMSDNFQPTDAAFEDGTYVTLTSEDMEDMNFGKSGLEAEDMINTLLAIKSEDNSYIMAYIVEGSDKDAAADIYDYFLDQFGTTEKQIKKDAKKHNAEYGFEEDDNKLSIIMVSEDSDKAKSVCIKLDGKVVSLCLYEGSYDIDLIDEYFEFSPKAGFDDMQALLEE